MAVNAYTILDSIASTGLGTPTNVSIPLGMVNLHVAEAIAAAGLEEAADVTTATAAALHYLPMLDDSDFNFAPGVSTDGILADITAAADEAGAETPDFEAITDSLTLAQDALNNLTDSITKFYNRTMGIEGVTTDELAADATQGAALSAYFD